MIGIFFMFTPFIKHFRIVGSVKWELIEEGIYFLLYQNFMRY